MLNIFDPAQLNSIETNAGITSPSSLAGLLGVDGGLLDYILIISELFLLFNVITAGFKVMTSVGEPKELENAKVKIKNSLIGMFLVFAAFWIVKFILTFFAINLTIY